MFVIVEAWKNLTPEELKLPLPEQVAMTMKHAGVSVTVTSVTDIVAFAIGASTVRTENYVVIRFTSVCKLWLVCQVMICSQHLILHSWFTVNVSIGYIRPEHTESYTVIKLIFVTKYLQNEASLSRLVSIYTSILYLTVSVGCLKLIQIDVSCLSCNDLYPVCYTVIHRWYLCRLYQA